MIGDEKEHVCSGCYQVIAPHDPEAYQQGKLYYHSKAHEDRRVSLDFNAFLRAAGSHPQEVFQELKSS